MSKFTSIQQQYQQIVNQAKGMFPDTLDESFKARYFKSNTFHDYMRGETKESPIFEGPGTRVRGTLEFEGKNYMLGDDSDQTFQVANDRVTEVHAGGGNDRLYDFNWDGVKMYGGAGNDYIQGGGGDDVISGGTGVNELYGYGGNDTFIFDDVSNSVSVVKDFNIYDYNENDKIQLSPEGNQKYSLFRKEADQILNGQDVYAEQIQILNISKGSWMHVNHATDFNDILDAMGAKPVLNANAQLTHFVDLAGNEITIA